MLHGFTHPRTPGGTSSLVATPPWHFAGDILAVTFEADAAAAASLLPEGLELASAQCAVYFIDWQFATDAGDEYLDPSRSQYRETLFLLSARFEGTPVSFCPFIWVDQDISLMRGLIQGWPKQLGSTWITRPHTLVSKAAPTLGPGGRFGASLCVKDRRLAEARVTVRESDAEPPAPGFAKAVNLRYFPDLTAGRHHLPLVHDLVQLKSRDVQISSVWKGDAELTLLEHPTLELTLLKPTKVLAGYRFSAAMTVDDLVPLKDLRRN
jgi:acetoacetate decarboxylase